MPENLGEPIEILGAPTHYMQHAINKQRWIQARGSFEAFDSFWKKLAIAYLYARSKIMTSHPCMAKLIAITIDLYFINNMPKMIKLTYKEFKDRDKLKSLPYEKVKKIYHFIKNTMHA